MTNDADQTRYQRYQRGDWVTIGSDPHFLRGRRGVVVTARVLKMDVAYVNSGGRVEVRNVRIDSVTPGHTARPSDPMAEVNAAMAEHAVAAAREFVDFIIARGDLDAPLVQQLLDEWRDERLAPGRVEEEARLMADQELLTAWLDEHGSSVGVR